MASQWSCFRNPKRNKLLWTILHNDRDISYRVGSDVNSLGLSVFNQRWVGEVRVALDLEDGRNDTGSLDDGFNLK